MSDFTHYDNLCCFKWHHFVFLWLSNLMRREGNGTPLQYSCLENPMDRGAWWAAVHGVAEGRTQLSNFTFTFYFHALEKEMATHSSVLAWRIPGMGEPGGLLSMGSHRVGHDWSDLAAAAAATYLNSTLPSRADLSRPPIPWTTVHGVAKSQTQLSMKAEPERATVSVPSYI